MVIGIKEFMDIVRGVQDFLKVSTFEMHMSDDYCCADFRVVRIEEVPALFEVCCELIVRLYSDEGFIRIRVYNETYQ